MRHAPVFLEHRGPMAAAAADGGALLFLNSSPPLQSVTLAGARSGCGGAGRMAGEREDELVLPAIPSSDVHAQDPEVRGCVARCGAPHWAAAPGCGSATERQCRHGSMRPHAGSVAAWQLAAWQSARVVRMGAAHARCSPTPHARMCTRCPPAGVGPRGGGLRHRGLRAGVCAGQGGFVCICCSPAAVPCVPTRMHGLPDARTLH